MFSDIMSIVLNRNIDSLVKKEVGVLKSTLILLTLFVAFSIGIGLVGATDLAFYFQKGILSVLGLALWGFIAISVLAIAQFGIGLILGGKGHLKDFYSKSIYLSALIFSLFFSAYLALFIILRIFTQINIQLSGFVIVLLVMAQIILNLYLNFILIKKFMNIGDIKAGIALIVPIVALLFLLLIATLDPFITVTRQPNAIAAQDIARQINQLGLPKVENDILFTTGEELNTKIIAERSKALPADQICVLLSSKMTNQFTRPNNQIIKYYGTTSRRTRLLTICDRQEDIKRTIDDFGFGEQYGLDASTCGFSNDIQTACIVAIIPSN